MLTLPLRLAVNKEEPTDDVLAKVVAERFEVELLVTMVEPVEKTGEQRSEGLLFSWIQDVLVLRGSERQLLNRGREGFGVLLRIVGVI